jgi:hypothetical protein
MKADGPTDSNESVSDVDCALLRGEAAGVQQVRKVDPESVERAIDFMEEIGMPLVPWQAMAFRAIMLWDGKIEVMAPRDGKMRQGQPVNPFWGGPTALQTPPWGGLEA